MVFLKCTLTFGVSFSKGLRGSSCQVTPTFERITDLTNCTKTLIDDTLCYNPFLLSFVKNNTQMCNYFMEIFGYNTQMSYIYIEFKTKKK